MDTFAPGVEVIEKDAFAVIQAPGTQFSGALARSKRGPDDRLTFCSNIDQFLKRYGHADANHPYGYETARDYFDEGGIGLYFGRVVGATAAKGSVALKVVTPSGAPATTITIEASSFGAWGNITFLSTTKWSTLSNGALGAPANAIVVDSVTGAEIGDVVAITDGVAYFVGIVYGINVGTKTLSFRQQIPAMGDNATVKCTSTHRAKTTLAAAFSGSPTQIEVANAALIDKGALLLAIAADGSRVVEMRCTEKNGNVIAVTTLYGDTVATEIPAGSVVVSVNFAVTYTVDGVTEIYSDLTLESTNPTGYFIDLLKQTEYLRGVMGAAVVGTYRCFIYPEAVTQKFLTGGLDGSAPVDNDYTGENNTKAYTHGLKLLDRVAVLPQFGIPAASTVVQKAADAYAQLRQDTIFVMEAPLTADTLDELLDYRNVTLNIQSSYSALYAPWLVEADVLTPGATIKIPPTGKVLGTYSEVSQRRGTQKPPANEPLSGVLDVTASFTDTEFGILNGSGVNLIRNIAGRGIRVAGARTLWPRADRKQFVNVRRILNAVKIGFKQFGIDLAQEPNDDVLWAKTDLAGKAFLGARHRDGWFYPRNDASKAYLFQCDGLTNTEALRLAAKVRSVAGVNPVLPGELIRFEVFLFDGGAVNVNEI